MQSFLGISLFEQMKQAVINKITLESKDMLSEAQHQYTCRLFARGQRVDAIAVLSGQGVIAVDIVTGSVNGDKFFNFL